VSPFTIDQIRATWATQQGLATPRESDPVDVIASCGWPRTLGGASAYLAVLSRAGHVDGARVDAAVEAGELWVVPAARGCIYLVPADDAALALRWGWLTAKRRHDRDVEKAGTSWQEIERVAEAALAVLHQSELSTQGMRRALPAGTVRSLGAPGKKVGMSSTLPLALRLLESRGSIRRVLATGRLDKESYAWRVLKSNAIEDSDLPGDLGALAVPFMRRFLEHTGPATRRELADWAGSSQRVAQAALDALGTVTLDVVGADAKDPFVALPQHVDSIGASEPQGWSLLPMLDPYTDYRNNMAWLTKPRHHNVHLRVNRSKTRPIAEMKTLWQRVVLHRGCVAGLWEFNPETERVEVGLFERTPDSETGDLETLIDRVGSFLREGLGHGRSFSLDTPQNMLRQVESVRQQAHVLGA
jgi:hypothetical protein